MSAAGFWCTVAGLLSEALGLGVVAVGIERRIIEYGRRLAYEREPVRFRPIPGVLETRRDERRSMDQRVDRLEVDVNFLQRTSVEAAEQIRAELDSVDTTITGLRQRVGGVEGRVQLLGLGDVRGDWRGLYLAAGGVVLTLTGTILNGLGLNSAPRRRRRPAPALANAIVARAALDGAVALPRTVNENFSAPSDGRGHQNVWDGAMWSRGHCHPS